MTDDFTTRVNAIHNRLRDLMQRAWEERRASRRGLSVCLTLDFEDQINQLGQAIAAVNGRGPEDSRGSRVDGRGPEGPITKDR